MGLFGNWQQNRRLSDLTERMEIAERQLKQLRAEWDDTYDKIRVAMGRIVKRAAVVEAAEAERPAAAAEPAPVDGRMLDERQRSIQMDILRRRARM